ncbi:MAG: glutamate racemase [Steroidobacterales bacterium]
MADPARPIGVFDSGVGGLTVLGALRAELPHEQFVYLGDTARLPYGTKSAETVVRYALQATDALVARDVKALIVACNTASGMALPSMRARYGALPVIGVVEPGADAAVAATRSGGIAVIGTEATVRGGAYQRAIAQRRPDATVTALACQLFVALAEEGWTQGEVARAIAQRYLAPLFASGPELRLCGEERPAPGPSTDTLVLGCTHFPALRAVIRDVVGEQVTIVDSAATTARAARALLTAHGLLRTHDLAPQAAALSFLATDGVARFASIGGRFLGRPMGVHEIELIDL